MLLEYLEVLNFRNLMGEIVWDHNFNIISGGNGQGKTNWLEAVFTLATSKSFKTSKLQEAINFGENMAFVRGKVRQSQEISHLLQVTLEGNTKTLSINGKKESVSRYLRELNAVIYNAESLEVVRGGPDARRRFLDEGITGIYPPFIKTLSDYSRVVRQKNSLLQSLQESDASLEKAGELLEPWNEQLIVIASKIHKARVRYVERINEALETRLFEREEISIRYVSSLEGKGDLSDYPGLMAERLKLRVQAELASGYTLIGPHRDDMEILFDGKDLRSFGSSGQQRSALLLLLLANIAVYHSQHNEYPLFLLDDIDAELDYRRIGQLLEYLNGKTQTFVTTSKESFVERFGARGRIFLIEQGAIKPDSATA
jgi:DNA replication and repair protein RecF